MAKRTISVVCIRSHDGKKLGQGKYGRWIAEIVQANGGGETLSEALLKSGNAKQADY